MKPNEELGCHSGLDDHSYRGARTSASPYILGILILFFQIFVFSILIFLFVQRDKESGAGRAWQSQAGSLVSLFSLGRKAGRPGRRGQQAAGWSRGPRRANEESERGLDDASTGTEGEGGI